jgi:hypothetical protein
LFLFLSYLWFFLFPTPSSKILWFFSLHFLLLNYPIGSCFSFFILAQCLWVFAHYGDLIWTLQWNFFMYFPIYKKINKIKFIEIIEKGTHLSKMIIVNLPRMKKSN